MKIYQNMLMVGSSGRNLGKTEFICQLIKDISQYQPVTAIKITVVEDEGGVISSPSSQHCESYKLLTDDYSVFYEVDKSGTKDTQRMLRAGASNAFWILILRSKMGQIGDILDATLDKFSIDHNAPIIVEGISSLKFIEPGMLILIKEYGVDIDKKSCLNAVPFADSVIESYGDGWSINPIQIKFYDMQWHLEEKASVIILAGGKSQRMGVDKSTLEIDGVPMLEYIYGQVADSFDQVLVSSNKNVSVGESGAEIIGDLEDERGPLMGMVSCLEKSVNEINFVCACDCPVINLPFVRKMISSIDDYDAVVPVSGENVEPLFAVYKKSVVRVMKKQMLTGVYKVKNVLLDLKVRYIPISEGWFFNVNTPEQYEAFLNRMESS